jgi:MYXO-CTERM domain-containing protein
MLNALRETRVVSCTEASWRMFGLSFAGWNAVASAGLAVLALAALWTSRRRAPI